ncbi:MAG: sensor histidine kinase N-terminal domain-containing protein, partial [Planctomycetota bacterium]
MRSIRRRLMVVLAAGFCAVIAGVGVYLDGALGGRATEEFDASLLARARALVALTEQEAGRIELDYAPEVMPEFERADAPDYFQFWLDDGSVRHRSRRLQGDLPRSASLSPAPDVRDATLPDGRPGRIAQLAFVPRGPSQAADPEGSIDPATLDASAGARALILVVARGRE